jgi:hypothetical protein
MKKLIVLILPILAIGCANVKTRYVKGCPSLDECVSALSANALEECENRNAKFRMVDKGWEDKNIKKVYMKYLCI